MRWPPPSPTVSHAKPGHTIVLHGGILVDGGRPQDIERSVIVIENGMISQIGTDDSVKKPTDAESISAEGMWVLPGFIDCHVHLTGQRSLDAEFEAVRRSADIRLLHACNDSRAALVAGHTILRDIGSDNGIVVSAARQETLIAAPRILTATRSLASTAGPGDSPGLPRGWVAQCAMGVVLADGIRGCRLAAREAFRNGAEFLSVLVSGGCPVSGIREENTPPDFSSGELRAIADEARHRGARVAATAVGALGLKAAIDAGVDTIENGVAEPDPALLDAMATNGISLVPNLSAFVWSANEGAEAGVPHFDANLSKRLLDRQLRFVQAARQAGVNVAAGTDRTGQYGPNGIQAELTALASAGFGPREVINCASRNAALACGLASDAGTIQVGSRAELIVTTCDPVRDIARLGEPNSIFRVIAFQPLPPTPKAMS